MILLELIRPALTAVLFFYSNQDYYGSHIAEVALGSCERRDDLFTNYLGDGPSDNYNKFPPVPHPEIETLGAEAKKYEPQSYGDIDKRLFIPHSWSFFAGTGFCYHAKIRLALDKCPQSSTNNGMIVSNQDMNSARHDTCPLDSL